MANEIIQIIETTNDPKISIESRAQQQWREVLVAVRQRGRQRGSPQFKDPITRHLVKTQFSWEYLCNIEVSVENWEQKRWCEAFALTDEIREDLLAIEAPAEVLKIAKSTLKPAFDKKSSPGDQSLLRNTGFYKSVQRLKNQGPVDTKGRIALLKQQAEGLNELITRGVRG